MLQRLRTILQNILRSKFVRDTLTLQAGTLVLTAVNALSFVVIVRGLGPEQYGVYQLVITMHGLLMTLNLTGLGPSTITRLAEAVGAGDGTRARDLMAFFLQASLAVAVLAGLVAWAFGPAFAAASYDNATIGELYRVYVLILFFDPIYRLVLLTLQSLRAMRAFTILENGMLLLEALLKIGVILLGGGARGVVLAHVAAVILRAAVAVILYRAQRRARPALLPTIPAVLRGMLRNSPRPYWQFGFWLALDKNISSLYTLLPVQIVAMVAGEAAAGFLRLGLNALSYPNMLFKGILTNLETRLPADAGQGNYIRLADNFRRLNRWLIPASAALYGGVALFAPLAVPVLGEEYAPAIGVIRALCVYGLITGIGGSFGPLYRTLRMLGAILGTKIAALALAALPGLWLITTQAALGGAWTINLVYALSVGLTMALVWPRLRRLAQEQRERDAAG